MPRRRRSKQLACSGADETPVARRPDAHLPLECEWISDELLARTQKVWSDYLGRDVPAEEATEILLNVQRIAHTFHEIAMEQKRESAEEDQFAEGHEPDPMAGWCPDI